MLFMHAAHRTLSTAVTAELTEGLRELLHSVRRANEVKDVDPRRKRGRSFAGDGGLL